MMKSRKPYIIAQEGWLKIAIRFIAFLVLMLLDLEFFACLALIYTGFVAYSYLDPEILSSSDEKEIISPSSGNVDSIQTKEESIDITINCGLFDNSIIRAPISGTIENYKKVNGLKLSTANILSNHLNTQISFDIVNDNQRVTITVIEDSCAFGLDSLIENGMKVNSSHRVAICTNYKMKISLPKDILLNIDLNSTVKQGESVIGFCK
jgi:phosphatidylserine decarboxylase